MTRPPWRVQLDAMLVEIEKAERSSDPQKRLAPGQRRLIMKAIDEMNARLDVIEQRQAIEKAQRNGHSRKWEGLI